MMCEIWVMRASPAVAQGVAPRGAVGRNDEAWAVFATNANVPADGVGEGGGTSCGGESWRANSYNGIHWVAESVLAPERIPSM